MKTSETQNHPAVAFGEILENVRRQNPVIHNITNYVTVNDCANILLACGASPIMADDEDEMADISACCSGLVINIGTLNKKTEYSMTIAGRYANELGHPVVLDPVGAGASSLRTETAKDLIRKVHLSVIRGNMSEIRALALGTESTRGVDAVEADRVTEDNLYPAVAFAKSYAAYTGAVISISGAIDIVADAEMAYCVHNGHPLMSAVTGAGCMLSALTAAYVAAAPKNVLNAAAAAVCAMGLCGETAYQRMSEADGNSSYRNYLIDAVYRLTPAQLEEGARYEILQ